MAADKIIRKANAARSKDAARNNGRNGGGKHDPAATPSVANKLLTRSRLADTLFLAHRFASRFQQPQPTDKQRADAARDNARDNTSYRKSAKRPAKMRRIVSKKI